MPKLLSFQEVLPIFQEAHPNKTYIYHQDTYKNDRTKMKITCSIHSDFWMSPSSHKQGHGCPKCGDEARSSTRITQQDFIQKLEKIFENCDYDFNQTIYKGSQYPVKVICPKHGVFEKLAHSLIYRQSGCPYCKMSSGELKIRNLLIKYNILFKYQYSFKECRGVRNPMPFDFYLPKLHTCIEFDGKQHFKPVSIFGGEKAFKDIQSSDKLKNEYCLQNNIRLIRIPHWEYRNIDNILSKNLLS